MADSEEDALPSSLPATVEAVKGSIKWKLATDLLPDSDRDALVAILEDFPFRFQNLEIALEFVPDEFRELACESIRYLIIEAQCVGIVGVKADTTREALTAQLKREVLSERQRMAGLRSVVKRRARMLWKEHATELAIRLRQQHPKLSQEDLAMEISFAWQWEEKRGLGALKKHVGELERKGVIPRQVK